MSVFPSHTGHIPVLLHDVLAAIPSKEYALYLDGTFGGGGYSRAILTHFPTSRLIAIDRDPSAIARARHFQEEFPERFLPIEGTFGAMKAHCANLPWYDAEKGLDAIILDLGLSSFQIDEAERGFSFKENGPLDMRMGHNIKSAEDIVNEASEEELANIFYYYGEERCARRIARKIIEMRAETPIRDTAMLANLIRACVPASKTKKDPATRSFQALRIAVNDELQEIQHMLEDAPLMLSPGGVLAIVSFHSLEDRLVKKAFSRLASPHKGTSRYMPRRNFSETTSSWTVPAGYPVSPSDAEVKHNPRARSSRLRVLKKSQPLCEEQHHE